MYRLEYGWILSARASSLCAPPSDGSAFTIDRSILKRLCATQIRHPLLHEGHLHVDLVVCYGIWCLVMGYACGSPEYLDT